MVGKIAITTVRAALLSSSQRAIPETSMRVLRVEAVSTDSGVETLPLLFGRQLVQFWTVEGDVRRISTTSTPGRKIFRIYSP